MWFAKSTAAQLTKLSLNGRALDKTELQRTGKAQTKDRLISAKL
jgi:hypothetical protein